VDTKTIPIRVATPRDYVEVTDIVFKPKSAEPNRLQVEVQARMDIPDPGCEVKLVLPPDIPGYTPPPKEENSTVALTKRGEKKVLFAAGLEFDQAAANENGLVYLTVDGVPRAFIYRTTFKRDGGTTTPERFDAENIRIQAQDMARSNDKFPVEIDVDNAPDGATVLLELGEQDNNGSFQVQRQSGPAEARYRHLGISAQSSDGALLFEANVGDQTLLLNTEGIAGKRMLRASLQRGNAAPKTALKQVILDNSKPTNLKFAGSQPMGNGLVEITVEGEDPESGVKKVKFHLGQWDDKKPPTNPPLAESDFDNDKKSLTKKVPIDKVGDVDLTAEFVNGVGMPAYLPIRVTVAPANGGGDDRAAKPGSVSGFVERNGRREPKAKVKLEGGKLKEPLNVTADERGDYKFPEVPPGTYKVSAVTEEGKAKGEIMVTVEAGKEKTGQTIAVSR
jgi:hypothetical protein